MAGDVRDEEEKDERLCGTNGDGEGGDSKKSSACACKGSDGNVKEKSANFAATAVAECCSCVSKNAAPGGEEDDYSANDTPSSEEEDKEDDGIDDGNGGSKGGGHRGR